MVLERLEINSIQREIQPDKNCWVNRPQRMTEPKIKSGSQRWKQSSRSERRRLRRRDWSGNSTSKWLIRSSTSLRTLVWSSRIPDWGQWLRKATKKSSRLPFHHPSRNCRTSSKTHEDSAPSCTRPKALTSKWQDGTSAKKRNSTKRSAKSSWDAFLLEHCLWILAGG